jgi:capsular exopolysaccharide synthesis family protein
MSKIFEALQQSRGGLNQQLPAALIEQMAPVHEAQAAADETATVLLARHEKGKQGEQETSIRRVSVPTAPGSPVFPFANRQSSAAEQYRMIRTRLVQNLDPHKLILITSPDSGDGKTTTSINVAAALAMKNDLNVLILDADLCDSRIAGVLNIPVSPGLSEVLRGTHSLRDAIVGVEQFPNLYVLPAGAPAENRTELLDSSRWKTICEALRSQFEFTMVDSPPINSVADYPLIEQICDGVIVVLRQDRTNRVRGEHALKAVPRDKLLGVIMNGVEDWFLLRNNHFHYYGYYNSYHSKGSEKENPK